ncbi:MAG TPA: right-handed parallel beta-helix repeat-containing protein [Planctomycetota bacterium]
MLSSFTATPTFGTSADGLAAAELRLVLADASGVALPGRRVRLETTGFANSVTQPPLTSAAGATLGTLRTTVGEKKRVTAVVDPGPNETRLGPVTVEFLRILPSWRFVRTSGSDANDGRTPLTAWSTLGFALSQMAAGETLFVGAGTYAEALLITTMATAEAPLVVRGDVTGEFTGDAGEVLIDAGASAAAIQLQDAAYVTLRGLALRGAVPGAGLGGGILAVGTMECAILDCRVYENGRGIELWNTSGTWLEGNRVSANTGDGLRLTNADGTRIVANLIYANTGDGIELGTNTTGLTIELNTLYRNQGDQIREATTGNAGVIANNVLSEGTGRGLGLAAGSGLGTNSNLTWLQTGNTPAATYSADPLFADPMGADGILGGIGAMDDDFRVLALSPTLDTGMGLARQAMLRLAPAMDVLGTRTDDRLDGETPDAATLNLGFHYGTTTDAFESLAPLGGRFAFAQPGRARMQTRALDADTDAWQAPRTTQTLGTDVRWLVQRVSTGPKPEEILAAQLDTGAGARLVVRTWDARRWSDDAPAVLSFAIAAANADERGFDVEYEAVTGNALLVRVDGAQNVLWQRLVEGAWSPSQPVFAPALATGTVLWTELVARPGTNEVALVALDDAQRLFAAIWNGTQWTRPLLLATQVNSLRDFRAFDVAWESLSGDLLVAWGYSQFAEETRFATLTRATDTWTTGQFVSTDALGKFLRLASDPVTDKIVAVFGEGTSDDDVGVSVWNGTNWFHTAEMTLTGIAQSSAMEVGWLGTSGLGFVIYRDQAQTGAFQWAYFNSGGWRRQPEVFLPGVGRMVRAEARRVPGTERVLVALLDETGSVWAVEHDGSAWVLANGGEPLATDLDPANAGRAFDFDLRVR